MADLAEKRVYADRTGASELLVAASPGLVSVALSAGRVGEFSLARRCAPTDIAAARHPDAGPTQVAVATDEEVLLAPRPAVEALEPSDFGPAVAVTFQAGQVVAGAADGRVAVHDGHRWTTVGEVPAPPAALDGDLVATPEGVFRLTDGDLRPAGLRAVSDVARPAGIPLAATADGLYELGNGWLAALDGEFRLATGARGGQAHAATADAFYERTADGWRSVELPTAGPVGAVAYGERPAVLTVDGDLLVKLDDGWRTHPLGIEGVVAAVAT